MKNIFKLSSAAVLALSLASVTAMAKDSKNPEEKFKKMDTNSDNKISEEEYEDKMEEKFKKMDTNSDGFLTMDEKKAAHDKKKNKKKKK